MQSLWPLLTGNMQEKEQKSRKALGAERLSEAPVARELLPLGSQAANSLRYSAALEQSSWASPAVGGGKKQLVKLTHHGYTKSIMASPADAKELRVLGGTEINGCPVFKKSGEWPASAFTHRSVPVANCGTSILTQL